MGRGPVIAQKKEASAKAKGKVYSLHSKLISLAAEKGADIALNTSLHDAISAAKKDGVTADVIDRAIKRGAGLDKAAAKVEEVFYEGYAPGGVAVIVRALTDNRNRTAPSIRHIFSAFGGNMGETGSVSNFAFEYKGQLRFALPNNMESLESAIMETGAEDYYEEDGEIIVITDRKDYADVRSRLEKSGYTPVSSELGYRPKNYIEITDFDTALKIYKMLEAFDEDEDVENIWNTADIPDTVWKEVETFVESRKFKT